MSTPRLRNAGVGVIYLVVIASLIALSIAVYNKAFSNYVTVTLRTGSVGSSLQSGSDVKVRGVLVGSVKSVNTDGTGASITLDLDPSKAKTLPADVTGQLLPKTLFGESYVNLVLPAAATGATLRSGDVIKQDTTKRSIQLEAFFSDLLPVLRATQPQKLQVALTELSTGFKGQGLSLQDQAVQFGRVLKGIAPKVPRLATDLRKLNSVAGTYRTAAPEIIDALKSAAVVNQTVARQRQEVDALFASVTAMSNTVGSFVGTNSQSIIGLSAKSVSTLKILRRYGTEFPCIARALTSEIPVVNKALGVGTDEPGAHVNVRVIPRVGPYRPGADSPKLGSVGGPSCPYVPTNALSGTALSSVPGVDGASVVTGGAIAHRSQGLGVANTPAENTFIDELMAPAAGLSPASYPKWASLLLGPLLRGSTVTLR